MRGVWGLGALGGLLAFSLVGAWPAPPAAKPAVTGRPVPELEGFDRMMRKFLAERGLPGAAVAVARDGRLVYARGFGYADRAAKRPLLPGALFRIASISKPVTAVAVLKLVEEGKLRLDDSVFDLLRIKPHREKGKGFDRRLRKVTVLHCLQHTGGWDRGKSFDPMFHDRAIARPLGVSLPIGPTHIIRYMWGRPLDFDPGKRMAYSNFGYCVLGRIIEKASGLPYERYVKEHVLAPLGIRRMRLGHSLSRQCAPAEVAYHCFGRPPRAPAVLGPVGKSVLLPYGAANIENMDAHGGWLASAVDLVRFGSALARPGKSRVLKPATVEVMFAPPAGALGHDKKGKVKAAYYACGWSVRRVGSNGRNVWHTGLLAGASGLLVHRSDGLCWAVLFNASAPWRKAQPPSEIDGRMHRAANAVKAWPRHDLFAAFDKVK